MSAAVRVEDSIIPQGYRDENSTRPRNICDFDDLGEVATCTAAQPMMTSCMRFYGAAASSPHSVQFRCGHAVFRRGPLDTCSLVRRFNSAEPHLLGSDLVHIPSDRFLWFGLLCHAANYRSAAIYVQHRPPPRTGNSSP